MLVHLREKNHNIKIHNILCKSECFKTYGRVISDLHFSELIQAADQNTQVPKEKNIYVASFDVLENIGDIKKQISQSIYGTLDIQIGYCNGNNNKLNALEWHNGSEVVIAVSDLILLLSNTWKMRHNSLHTNDVEAFFVPAGKAVELFSTTMHFAPCKVSKKGFKAIIVLLRGTNEEISELDKTQLLYKKNKWIIAHNERQDLIDDGVFPGLIGDNIEIFN